MGIKCFMIEPAGKAQRYLRRYRPDASCPGPMSYHNAMVPLDVIDETIDEDRRFHTQELPEQDHSSALWPTRCVCGYQFLESDEWQTFVTSIFRRIDNGQEMTLRDAPVGAMWDAFWFHDHAPWCGSDGKALMCKLPGNHDWHIDGPSTNCPWKDSHPTHKCWVRHGVPPMLTVDKSGDTCPVGAGSIAIPGWHGFLRNGELVND
jgi:hypothetical protein